MQFGTRTERYGGTCALEHEHTVSSKAGTLFVSLLAKYWADIAAKRFACLVERFVREQGV